MTKSTCEIEGVLLSKETINLFLVYLEGIRNEEERGQKGAPTTKGQRFITKTRQALVEQLARSASVVDG